MAKLQVWASSQEHAKDQHESSLPCLKAQAAFVERLSLLLVTWTEGEEIGVLGGGTELCDYVPLIMREKESVPQTS